MSAIQILRPTSAVFGLIQSLVLGLTLILGVKNEFEPMHPFQVSLLVLTKNSMWKLNVNRPTKRKYHSYYIFSLKHSDTLFFSSEEHFLSDKTRCPHVLK